MRDLLGEGIERPPTAVSVESAIATHWYGYRNFHTDALLEVGHARWNRQRR